VAKYTGTIEVTEVFKLEVDMDENLNPKDWFERWGADHLDQADRVEVVSRVKSVEKSSPRVIYNAKTKKYFYADEVFMVRIPDDVDDIEDYCESMNQYGTHEPFITVEDVSNAMDYAGVDEERQWTVYRRLSND